MFLCIIIFLSSEEEEYQTECYLILYKLLKIENLETQKEIMENLGGKQSKELGFLLNLNINFILLLLNYLLVILILILKIIKHIKY